MQKTITTTTNTNKNIRNQTTTIITTTRADLWLSKKVSLLSIGIPFLLYCSLVRERYERWWIGSRNILNKNADVIRVWEIWETWWSIGRCLDYPSRLPSCAAVYTQTHIRTHTLSCFFYCFAYFFFLLLNAKFDVFAHFLFFSFALSLSKNHHRWQLHTKREHNGNCAHLCKLE